MIISNKIFWRRDTGEKSWLSSFKCKKKSLENDFIEKDRIWGSFRHLFCKLRSEGRGSDWNRKVSWGEIFFNDKWPCIHWVSFNMCFSICAVGQSAGITRGIKVKNWSILSQYMWSSSVSSSAFTEDIPLITNLKKTSLLFSHGKSTWYEMKTD